MTAPPLPPIWRTIKFPVLISIVVLVVRLAGELAGWDPRFFSREMGGGAAIVGVGWLMPIFGFAFGWQLTNRGHAPDRPGLSIILHVLGLALVGAGIALIMKNVAFPVSLGALAGLAIVALLFGWRGWPELIRYTLAYAVVVRLAVAAVTAIAFSAGWGTHFEQLPPEFADHPATERLAMMVAPQFAFWIPATVLVGGVFGCIAAMIRGRRSDDAPDD